MSTPSSADSSEPQPPAPPSRQTARSNATRRKLLDAARALFSARGYAAVGTEEIVRAAGVTRGALYHQFPDKAELLAALIDEIDGEVSQQIAAGALAGATNQIEALVAGSHAFLDAVVERPEVSRVSLIDGVSVLGWERRRAIGQEHGLGLIEAVLTSGMDDGLLRRAPARPLAHVLLGALDEAALYVAAANDTDAAREEMRDVTRVLIEALKA